MIFLLVIAALKLIDLLSLTMKMKLILCRGIKIRSNIKVYYIFSLGILSINTFSVVTQKKTTQKKFVHLLCMIFFLQESSV